MADNFKLDVDADGIALITWDMPGKSMNVIDMAVIQELSALVEKIAADAAIKGAVITSGKDTFCAGADLTLLDSLTRMFADMAKKEGEVAAALEVPEQSSALRFRRMRSHEGRPVLSEIVYMRYEQGKKALSEDKLMALAEVGWTATGLATRKRERVSSGKATADDAKRLKISAGTPVLMLERVIYSYENTPLELRYAVCHLGDDLISAASV